MYNIISISIHTITTFICNQYAHYDVMNALKSKDFESFSFKKSVHHGRDGHIGHK